MVEGRCGEDRKDVVVGGNEGSHQAVAAEAGTHTEEGSRTVGSGMMRVGRWGSAAESAAGEFVAAPESPWWKLGGEERAKEPTTTEERAEASPLHWASSALL